ncbi:MAG: YesL family protein [Vallitaleaceae bacterium]|nr:YesL family protein [Vallitaleaceae bacterium]
MNLFSLDGPIQKYGTILFDMIILSFLWVIISLASLGILMGPATCGLYYSAHHSIIHQSSSTLKSFFSAFKRKFKYAIIGWLILTVVISVSIVALNMIKEDILPSILFPVYVTVIIYMSMMAPYYIALTTMTKMKFKLLVKYSFFLSIKHLPTTILLLIIMIVSGMVLYLTNYITILILPAAIGLVASYLITDKASTQYDFSLLEPEEDESINTI